MFLYGFSQAYVIHLFELASSPNVNLNKSTISLVNVDANRLETVARNWAFLLSSFLLVISISYLGVPLVEKPLSKPYRENVCEKISKKVSNWKYT